MRRSDPALCLLLTLWAAAGMSAAALGQGGSDFAFYFGVKGYEANSWFAEPSALALDERSGLIYVADTKAGVVDAFSLQGIPKFQYGAKNDLRAPLGVARRSRSSGTRRTWASLPPPTKERGVPPHAGFSS